MQDGKFTFEEFQELIYNTVDYLKRDTYAARPEATKDSVMTTNRFRDKQDAERRAGVTAASLGLCPPSQPGISAKGFHVHGPRALSSYNIDLGVSLSDGPSHRPINDPVGAGLWSTTRDLAAGMLLQCYIRICVPPCPIYACRYGPSKQTRTWLHGAYTLIHGYTSSCTRIRTE
jgi:hypothetical protein